MENKNNYLVHHGILGMKWGIRRYQNKDGTLTPAGRRRAAMLEEKYEKVTGKKMGEASTSSNTKKLSEMTDEELKTRLSRLQMEKNYMDLNKQISDMNPKKVSKGKAFLNTLGGKVIAPALTDAGKNLLTKYINKKGAEMLGLDEKQVKDAAALLKEEVEGLKLKKQKIELEKYFNKNSSDTSSKEKESSADTTSNWFTKQKSNKSKGADTVTTDKSATDPVVTNYARIGTTYIAGLLEAPKNQ